MQYPGPIQRMIEHLTGLPGIGARTAERIALNLVINQPLERAIGLADAIRDARTRIKLCSRCFNMTELTDEASPDPSRLCDICADPARDASMICVVEHARDLLSIETRAAYKGVYHVLAGQIAPLENAGPELLTIDALLNRIDAGGVREVIFATNAERQSDATIAFLISEIRSRFPDIQLSRLARGLASGMQIQFANETMLKDALEGRRGV